MRQLLQTISLAFAVILSGQSPATAGELLFGKDNEWVVFKGPIILDEIDDILSQIDEKNQN